MSDPMDYEPPPEDKHEQSRRAGFGISVFLGFCGGLGTGVVGLLVVASVAESRRLAPRRFPASLPPHALLRGCAVFAAIALCHFAVAAYAYRRGYRGYLLGVFLGLLLTLLPLGLCFLTVPSWG